MMTDRVSIREWAARICTMLLLPVLGGLLPGMAAAATMPPEQLIAAWTQAAAHPLAGRIWVGGEGGRLIDGGVLARGQPGASSPVVDATGLMRPTFVLLGEVHDNPGHHQLRAGLIGELARLAAVGRLPRPAIVSEHIDDGRADKLVTVNRAIAEGETTADGLLETLGWEKSGWPAASLFRPLFAAIVEARLSLHAGNVPRGEIRDLVRSGAASIAAERARRFGLDRALGAPLEAALAAELSGSHCGMLPASAVPGMASAQRYRDGRMADAMIEAARGGGKVILIAGNGHVRSDRGVPWHIRAADGDASVRAVMLIEVVDGQTDPLAYLPRDPDGRPAADVVIFTPRAAREDPCARMRAGQQRKG